MLSCRNLTVRVPNSAEPILKDAEVSFRKGAMNAVIGPSGCGKTTLIKAMMKIIPSQGESFICGDRISKSEDLIGRLGFAPQFTCVHPHLTVLEAMRNALAIATRKGSSDSSSVDSILKITGLYEHADKLVGSLSGGQLRRMGLAVELANDPPALCCDEVTSGLDPLSENTILELLRKLCAERGKTFICIIHNLAKLDMFDTVTVVYNAEVVFQGTPPELNDYFGIDSPLSLYDRLNECGIAHWRDKWSALKLSRGDENCGDENSVGEGGAVGMQCAAESRESGLRAGSAGCGSSTEPAERATWLSQFSALLLRRVKLFFRDTSYLFLTMLISFGFPLVVVIFALGGLPQIESLALDRNLGAIEELRVNLNMQISAANTSTIVTGLILFQVILLALMGANNSAREIASERALYEKERLIGLRPSAYAASKIAFTFALAIFQGVWMCGFVKYICGFPGSFAVQALELSLVSVSMTAVCLAFSALFSSPEKANLVSIYLVGFQLPLSGVVLALPEFLKWICRPFISAYWGWAGYMTAMKDTRLYDAYVLTRPDWEFMPSPSLAASVLILQAAIALIFVYVGCSRKNWN